jgi:CheY-like chemotaxis protein
MLERMRLGSSEERNGTMSAPSDRKYTVLIVDDNADLLSSLTFALSTLGPLIVRTATDGADGLEQVYSLRPDCVVIDVKMPEVDGIQLVRALRGDPETAGIPVVILSALVQENDQALGMFAGADQYLTKPAKPQAVAEAIRRAIALSAEDRMQRMLALTDDAGDGEDA